MNLIEARKQAHDGWVRSPTRTDGDWLKLDLDTHWRDDAGKFDRDLSPRDIDVEDWEPKPELAKLFEIEILVHDSGIWTSDESDAVSWEREGWRKILVREVEK